MSGDLLPPERPDPPIVINTDPNRHRQASSIVVVAGHRPQPRLHSGGWFTRSFGAASGVMAAMLLFFAILPLAVCGGLAWWGREANVQEFRRTSANDATLTATARQMAIPTLTKQGIVELSNDSGAYVGQDGYTHFTGTGRTAAGKLLGFTVKFKVVTFGQKTTWKTEAAIVDGRMVVGEDY